MFSAMLQYENLAITSFRDHRVSRLYLVFTFVYPVCSICCTQSLRDGLRESHVLLLTQEGMQSQTKRLVGTFFSN